MTDRINIDVIMAEKFIKLPKNIKPGMQKAQNHQMG